jgi:EmrB/QacA subfamily drug resistance transporter
VVPDNRWRILTTVLFGLFAVNVTITILAVSIHRIADELGTSEPTMTWAVTGPMLAFGVVGPLVGKLGDRLGHRRLFLFGLVGAALCAVASAAAWNAGSLIAFRTLGAVEGAATGPASFAVISRVFPRHERVRALGYWSMVGAGAPVVGVVLGGPLVEHFGWRTMFLGQVPLILLALVLAWRVFPETPRHAHGAFDLAGAALVALTVTPVLFAVSEVPRLGWGSPAVVASLVVAPLALLGFVRVERRAANPLFPLHYLGRPGFTFAILTQALLNAAYMGSFILTPLFLQNVLDFSETKTGLVSIARPLAFSLMGIWAGTLARRLGAKPTAVAGAVAVVAAMGWMATFGVATHVWSIMGALALAGIGMGIAMPPLTASVTASVDAHDYGIAGAAQQMMNQVGVVIGITTMQSVQQARLDAAGEAASYPWGYLTGLACAAIGVVTATRIVSALRGRTAEETEDIVEAEIEGALDLPVTH